MSDSPSSNNTGRPSELKAEYMIINLDYSVQLIFTIEDGAKFLEIYSKARRYKERYNETSSIESTPGEMRITYLTRKDIADIQFAQTVGVKPDGTS
jgi:hypothetical protein